MRQAKFKPKREFVKNQCGERGGWNAGHTLIHWQLMMSIVVFIRLVSTVCCPLQHIPTGTFESHIANSIRFRFHFCRTFFIRQTFIIFTDFHYFSIFYSNLNFGSSFWKLQWAKIKGTLYEQQHLWQHCMLKTAPLLKLSIDHCLWSHWLTNDHICILCMLRTTLFHKWTNVFSISIKRWRILLRILPAHFDSIPVHLQHILFSKNQFTVWPNYTAPHSLLIESTHTVREIVSKCAQKHKRSIDRFSWLQICGRSDTF